MFTIENLEAVRRALEAIGVTNAGSSAWSLLQASHRRRDWLCARQRHGGDLLRHL